MIIIWLPYFLYNMFYSLCHNIYFVKKNNRRLQVNVNNTVFFFQLSVERRWDKGWREGRGRVFFTILYLKFILYLSYIFIQKNPIFLYNFCRSRFSANHSRKMPFILIFTFLNQPISLRYTFLWNRNCFTNATFF